MTNSTNLISPREVVGSFQTHRGDCKIPKTVIFTRKLEFFIIGNKYAELFSFRLIWLVLENTCPSQTWVWIAGVSRSFSQWKIRFQRERWFNMKLDTWPACPAERPSHFGAQQKAAPHRQAPHRRYWKTRYSKVKSYNCLTTMTLKWGHCPGSSWGAGSSLDRKHLRTVTSLFGQSLPVSGSSPTARPVGPRLSSQHGFERNWTQCTGAGDRGCLWTKRHQQQGCWEITSYVCHLSMGPPWLQLLWWPHPSSHPFIYPSVHSHGQSTNICLVPTRLWM